MARESSLSDPAVSSTAFSIADEHSQKTAVAWIAYQARLNPNAMAVASTTCSLSFGELASASSALASRICAAVAPATPVALYLPSSTDFVVAALAAWKAGAPYLPIDVASPTEHAAYVLRDSGASVLLAVRDRADALPEGSWKTVLLDESAQTNHVEQVPDRAPKLEDLAYLIYTSGSTGKPKGVEITHRNLLHLMNWHTQAFEVTSRDRATQIASPAFDAAVWEIWPHLCSGASVHIPPAGTAKSSALLRDWLLAERISISFAPTALAEELMRLSWPASADLRILLTGGDSLHTFPPPGLPFEVINNYGPTETTVVATSGVVSPAEEQAKAPTIGKEILQTAVVLLDEDGQPVRNGEIGEIVITGEGVGRGYRNHPELTALKFASVEVDGSPQRAFRTGDLGRRLPDGQLAFAGRADGQVKIRAFRIELDEIVFNLNQHGSILSSAVIADGTGAEKRLVGYVVLRDGEKLAEAQLREFLRLRLPEYMIPAQFVKLGQIPVTTNGKLNREALPAPCESNRLDHDPYQAPSNEVEQIVEGILRSILGLDRVSLHDNFFLLGGHSLMGAQVIARLRDHFGVEISLRNVFENPSVYGLSALVEALLMKRLEAMTEEEVLEHLSAGESTEAMFNVRVSGN